MKALLWLTFVMAVFSGSILFRIKYEVLSIENEIRSTETRLSATKERLHVLKTEWSYLTHPERIQKLLNRHAPQTQCLQKDQLLSLPAEHKQRTTILTRNPSEKPPSL